MSDAVSVRERFAPWTASWARLGPLGRLMAIGALTRVALFVIVNLAFALLEPMRSDGWNRGPALLQPFARWDSGFYMDIAELGYGFKPEAWPFNPGYPLTIAALRFVMPFLDPVTAGFLISNVAFFGAIWLVYRLTTSFYGDAVAWRTTLLFILFPGSFYFSAVYAESLFAVFLFGFFLALHQQRWLTAGALASLAAFTRPPGIVLVGALGVGLLVHTWRARRIDVRAWAAVPLALVLPAAFALYSWRMTGDPFVSSHMREVYWPNVQWRNPITTLFHFEGPPPALKAAMIFVLCILVTTLVYVLVDFYRARRLDLLPVYAFTLVIGVIYVGYSEWNPLTRYLVAVPPVFWMLGRVSSPRGLLIGLAALSSALLAFVASVFAVWGGFY